MKRISYEVVENKRGKFDAVKWVEWPGRDQRIHPPVSVRLNTYPTRKAAADACQYDADWQHIVDADAGRHSEIVCEVTPADKFEQRDESPLVKPDGKCVTVDGWDI